MFLVRYFVITGVIPISLFLLATGTVLCKAAINRGVRFSTGRYGCRQLKNIKFDGKCANLVCVPTFWGVYTVSLIDSYCYK